MPDAPNSTPATPTSISQIGEGWFSPPGADLDLDSLFPNPQQAPQTPAAVPPPAPPQATAPAPEWFLETPSGTKYRTAEDAIKGIAEKDRIIAASKAAHEQATRPAAPAENQSYATNPEKLFDDLVEAASSGNKRKYVESLARYNMDMLAPYAPLLAEVANEKALRTADARTHGVSQFVGTAEYDTAMENFPVLKQAVENVRMNPQGQAQLEELYRLSYLASLGLKTPELVRTAAQQPAAPTQNPRPTLSTSTPSLPAAGPSTQAPSLYSREGRKAIIESGQQRGVDGASWEQLGL